MWRIFALVLIAVSSSGVQGRNLGIIGGDNAERGEFPWIVSIRQLKDLGFTHFCGGSIIGEDWVVTAGHCCHGKTRFSISAVGGGVDLDIIEFEEQRKNIDKIILHENYNHSHPDPMNDICLLKTKTPFEWTEWVQPVKLPKSMAEYSEGTNGTVAGWGETGVPIIPTLPEHLKKVTVPVMSDEKCAKVYAEDNKQLVVIDSMICLQDPDNRYLGTCSGDSGGPFTINSTLVGLVSWGEGGCATTGYPSVLTQVSHFVDWIKDKMSNEM